MRVTLGLWIEVTEHIDTLKDSQSPAHDRVADTSNLAIWKIIGLFLAIGLGASMMVSLVDPLTRPWRIRAMFSEKGSEVSWEGREFEKLFPNSRGQVSFLARGVTNTSIHWDSSLYERYCIQLNVPIQIDFDRVQIVPAGPATLTIVEVVGVYRIDSRIGCNFGQQWTLTNGDLKTFLETGSLPPGVALRRDRPVVGFKDVAW